MRGGRGDGWEVEEFKVPVNLHSAWSMCGRMGHRATFLCECSSPSLH